MRKTLCALLALALCLGAAPALAAERLAVVAATFPLYDWTRAVVGDAPADVSLLLDSGVDPHSFQPSAQDILRLSGCDAFVYVGGESDAWVEDALKGALNPDLMTVKLLDALGAAAKEEVLVEGMQAEEDEDAGAPDEHVWLSLRNAQVLVRAIADALGAADPDHAAAYAANADGYIAQLAALDEAYAQAVADAPVKTLLFGDRFPFRYLADDYGLDYYAAFPGCSAEAEASFETVAFLAGKVDELNLPAVLTIEGKEHRVAQTVAENARSAPAVYTLDSMQSTTLKDAEAGATYLGIMAQNLETLRAALGGAA